LCDVIGSSIICLALVANGRPGGRYGVPFTIACRSSWGVRGAWFAVCNRLILSVRGSILSRPFSPSLRADKDSTTSALHRAVLLVCALPFDILSAECLCRADDRSISVLPQGVQSWWGGQVCVNLIGAMAPQFYTMRNHFPASVHMTTADFSQSRQFPLHSRAWPC
jgi:hypothetical protein